MIYRVGNAWIGKKLEGGCKSVINMWVPEYWNILFIWIGYMICY